MVIGIAGPIGDDKEMRMADAMAVVAGRSIRPCDVCGRKRARMYCAADDAYLCEPCDGSVHAANALSMRHERVRLAPNGAPMKVDRKNNINQSDFHMHGQPRKKAKSKGGVSSHHAAARVPGGFVVPSVDPHGIKMEFPGLCFEDDGEFADDHFTAEDFSGSANLPESPQPGYSFDSDFAQNFFLPDPNDAHFSRHIKSRTDRDRGFGGRDPEDEMIGVVPTDTGLVAQKWMTQLSSNGRVGNGRMYAVDTTAMRGSTEPNDKIMSGYGDAVAMPSKKGGKAGHKHGAAHAQPDWMKLENIYQDAGCVPVDMASFNPCDAEGLKGRKDYNVAAVPSLRLNLEDVMSSWQDREWMAQGQHTDSTGGNGDPNSSSVGLGSDEGRVPSALGRSGSGGGEDSARSNKNARKEKVSRYMEKRKTRLNQNNGKMIRYQVRKINAERRPRDKGRFVKRSPGGD